MNAHPAQKTSGRGTERRPDRRSERSPEFAETFAPKRLPASLVPPSSSDEREDAEAPFTD